ncbi:hypothetical protein RFI_02059 [Reticulomyxa filosa]|uniref:Uncharacterized protein n=1 Tax=Reticulomyxa filosa TaxID=46433 RepID=X6PAC9_RETFI|nr:hypothetical protein RFI_02059 [Reticulomyxa filosa]|eukprot:ETO35014.1 hypothetical protein RFI_02059 [Reticulomyxa filosa]
MKRIEYAIDYVKDKLIDQNGEKLLEEGATFLLGMNQKQLKEILIKNNLLPRGSTFKQVYEKRCERITSSIDNLLGLYHS